MFYKYNFVTLISFSGDANMELQRAGHDCGHASTTEHPDQIGCHSMDESKPIPSLVSVSNSRRYTRRTRFEDIKDWGRPRFSGSSNDDRAF
jgi:hypothetical protein